MSVADEHAIDAGPRDASPSVDDGAVTEEDVIDAAPDAGIADSGVGPIDTRWFEGEYRRNGGYLITRSQPYRFFRAWTESDGTRRVRLGSNNLGTEEGTWRPLSARAVEVRMSDGATTVIDEASMRANCQLLRFRGLLWPRSEGTGSNCPFVRTLSDRECSLAGRSITWRVPGPGRGTGHHLVLRESGAGLYISMPDRLDCDFGLSDCIYTPFANEEEHFEWRIEGDRLVGLPFVAIPTVVDTHVSRLPACRRGQTYGAPTNIDGERCGDGVCRGFEWSGDCPQDCGYQSDGSCPLGSRCEKTNDVCMRNSPTAMDGTCRPRCRISDESCPSACCGTYDDATPTACFPATSCGSSEATCGGYDQRCEDGLDCCIVGGRASACVVGLDPSRPEDGRCRPSCFRDSDCGTGMTCSCTLLNGRRVCSRTRGC